VKRHRGSFSALGIGIRAPSQTTPEASARIKRAEKVFSIVADPLAEYWISALNQNTESLGALYSVGKDRRDTYREMVERIVDAVRAGLRVCAVAYGHPGVAAYPLHESVRRLRAEGFDAEMLPGISAEDCLFADLGIDPVDGGCRSYEATDFLVHRRGVDTAGNLILWQVGAIAETGYKLERGAWNPHGIVVLTEVLLETYPPEHEVIVYEAAQLPVCEARIQGVALASLPEAHITPMSTLFVPPLSKPAVDQTMLRRLGIAKKVVARAGGSG
jgi:uncharacterized protein YabN with tetrapyrrole methylase and pyrophosphatase domain